MNKDDNFMNEKIGTFFREMAEEKAARRARGEPVESEDE